MACGEPICWSKYTTFKPKNKFCFRYKHLEQNRIFETANAFVTKFNAAGTQIYAAGTQIYEQVQLKTRSVSRTAGFMKNKPCRLLSALSNASWMLQILDLRSLVGLAGCER